MLDSNTIESFEKIATPFYYYDMDLLRATIAKVHELADRHNLRVHYAVKANSNERILREISAKGFGADCVSGNEVLHAHECGFPADRIVYAGVGKSDKEICNAMRLGIEAFNCESLQEIFVINEMAREYGVVANVSVRINPDIDAQSNLANGAKSVTLNLSDGNWSSTMAHMYAIRITQALHVPTVRELVLCA